MVYVHNSVWIKKIAPPAGRNKMIHCPGTEQFPLYQILKLSHTNNDGTVFFKTLPKWSSENFIPISKQAFLLEEFHLLTPNEETQN